VPVQQKRLKTAQNHQTESEPVARKQPEMQMKCAAMFAIEQQHHAKAHWIVQLRETGQQQLGEWQRYQACLAAKPQRLQKEPKHHEAQSLKEEQEVRRKSVLVEKRRLVQAQQEQVQQGAPLRQQAWD